MVPEKVRSSILRATKFFVFFGHSFLVLVDSSCYVHSNKQGLCAFGNGDFPYFWWEESTIKRLGDIEVENICAPSW